MKNEIEIPDGCEAKIVGNKVVFVPKESEDERIPRLLHELLCAEVTAGKFEKHGLTVDDALNWLERQKEYIEDIRQYAYNKGLVDAKQKPAEWSDKDESYLQTVISEMEANKKEAREYEHKTYDTIILWLKSIRPQPKQGWSKEDEGLIDLAVAAVEDFYDKKNHIRVEIINFLHSLRPQPQRRDTYYDIIHDILSTLKDMDFVKITPEHRVSLLNDIRVKCKNADECAAILDEPHWKPSEYQMKALYSLVLYGDITYVSQLSYFKSLYEDLKKL